METTCPVATPLASRCCEPKRSRDLVAMLRTATVFTEYQQAFQKTSGLPLVLRAVGALQSPLADAKKASSLVTLLGKFNQSSAAYLRFQGELERAAIDSSATQELGFGIVETMIPVRMGDTVVAFLQTGHATHKSPTAASTTRAIQKGRESGVELPAEKVQAAMLELPVIAKGTYEAWVSLLGTFASHLAILANQIAVSQTKAELPAVARARAYIEQHQTEEISLGDVARTVNMSVFYFCKVFRKVTGVTFVEYLARLRVENTKKLLLDPHTRISEAAFASGFQSLSQFNRVFLRMTGEAPTSYRDRAHSARLLTDKAA